MASLADYIDIIDKISTPIIAIASILLTCHFRKMSSRSNIIENYMQKMTELYYRIEDDSSALFDILSTRSASSEVQCRQLRRRISVSCTLMAYYLMRMPGYYKDRTQFDKLLISITYEPTKREYYDELSNHFENFCWGIRKNKKKSSRYIINLSEDGYPDKNRL